MTPVEIRVRIIFWIETVVLVIQTGQVLAVVIAAAFFTREFEEYILEGLSKSVEFRSLLGTLVKFMIIWWTIGFCIHLALLISLRRGITQRRTRSLQRWTVFGWIFVAYIFVSFAFQLYRNRWSEFSNVHTTSVIYNVIYGFYRIWANLVVVVFVDDIKQEEGNDEDSTSEVEEKYSNKKPNKHSPLQSKNSTEKASETSV